MSSSTDNQAINFTQAEEFRKYIEIEVLKIIKTLAEKAETSKERIQDIAKITLQLVRPGMSLDQLFQNALKLDDNYSELGPVVIHIMKQYEEKYEKKALVQIDILVKAQQFDQAQEMMKKILMFKSFN